MGQFAELLKKEAMAIQSSRSNKEAAAALRKAADALEAAAPVKVNFGRAIAADKMSRFEKFAKAGYAAKRTDMLQALQKAGYTLMPGKDKGVQVFEDKTKPGHQLIIENDAFTIKDGNTVIIDRQPLSMLESYLNKPKTAKV